MNGHPRTRRVVAVLAVLFLLAGCAGAATPTPGVSVSPSATQTATAIPTPKVTAIASPTVTPTPAPQAWGPAVLVRGVETCVVTPGPLGSPDADGTMHGRGGTLRCTDVANDPRVSGSVSGTFDADAWGPDSEEVAFVMWGTLRLENEGGAWEGRYTGANTTETGDMYEVWYTGTGGYAGLSYFQWVTPACAPVQDRLEFVGLIFPGPPPTP